MSYFTASTVVVVYLSAHEGFLCTHRALDAVTLAKLANVDGHLIKVLRFPTQNTVFEKLGLAVCNGNALELTGASVRGKCFLWVFVCRTGNQAVFTSGQLETRRSPAPDASVDDVLCFIDVGSKPEQAMDVRQGKVAVPSGGHSLDVRFVAEGLVQGTHTLFIFAHPRAAALRNCGM